MPFKKRILIVILMSLHFVACNNRNESQKSPSELREDLKTEEQINPTSYLTASANISQINGFILKGTIKNLSVIAKFKDVIIVINYLSETGTTIDTKEYIIYKFFEPNTETSFEYRIDPPLGFKNFNIEVKTATGVN